MTTVPGYSLIARILPKILPLITILTLVMIPVSGDCYLPANDEGFIEAIVDENIVVQGFLGTHVLELLGVCSWCEVGTSVAVRFISHTRAELREAETTIRRPPIRVFIIRDGRGEE